MSPVGRDIAIEQRAVHVVPENRSFLARIGWNGAAQLVPQLVSLAAAPFLVHRLGVDRYGIWAVLLALLNVLIALDGGIGASLARFFAVHRARDDREAAGRLLVSSIVVLTAFSALATVTLVVSAPALVGLLHLPDGLRSDAVGVIRSAGPLLALSLSGSVFLALLQAHNRFRALAMVTLSGAAVYGFTLVALIGAGQGLAGVAAATGAEFLTFVVVGALFARGSVRLSRQWWLRIDERRELWRFASRMQVAGFTGLVNSQTDALVVALLLPVRFVGLYALGAQAATALKSLPLWAMSPMSTRLATKYAQAGLPAAVEEFRSINRAWQKAVSGYALVGAVTLGFAVPAILGADFSDAGFVASILAAGYATNLATVPLSCLVRSIGRPGLEMRYGLIATGLNVALSVPLGLQFGLLGVVTATAISMAIGSAWFPRIARTSLGCDLAGIFWHRCWGGAVLAAAAAAGLELLLGGWRRGDTYGIAITLAAGFVCWAATAVPLLSVVRRWLSDCRGTVSPPTERLGTEQ